MQLLKSLLVTTVVAVGATASAIPPQNEDKVARQTAQCDVPPLKLCQPSGDPMNCNFCCVNFNPGPWSGCHKHGEVPCPGGGEIWHCKSHV